MSTQNIVSASDHSPSPRGARSTAARSRAANGVPLRRWRRGAVRTAGGVRQVQRAPGPEEEGRGSVPRPAGPGACGMVHPGDEPANTQSHRSPFHAVRPLAAGISSPAAHPASPNAPRPETWALALRLSGSWQSRTLWLLAPRSCARRRRARSSAVRRTSSRWPRPPERALV